MQQNIPLKNNNVTANKPTNDYPVNNARNLINSNNNAGPSFGNKNSMGM